MTSILSPTDGTVISRSVDVGQTVAASLSAPTLFVIAKDLREMQVDTSVAEADVGRLSPGMPATFTVDAFPGERFRGKVRQIRNAPQTVQNVVTYDAVIDVDNPDLKLRPGMTANVTFVAAEKDDVLRVPNAAMRFRPAPEIFAALGMPAPAAARDSGARARGAAAAWRGRSGASGSPARPGARRAAAGPRAGTWRPHAGGGARRRAQRQAHRLGAARRPPAAGPDAHRHVRRQHHRGRRGRPARGRQLILDASTSEPAAAPPTGPGGGVRRLF